MSVKKHMLISFLLCLMVLTLPVYKASADTALVAVDPSICNVTVGTAFNVTVNVTNVTNCTCWQLTLYYLNSVLNCNRVIEGPFLKSVNDTYYIFNITNNYDSTHGRVLVGSSLLYQNQSANGSGILATFTFQAMAAGDTLLHLTDIKLGDEHLPIPDPIPYTATDGIVHSSGAGPPHDVAVTNVTSPKRVICLGLTGNVTVTVENHGGNTETFNVTTYANYTATGNTTSIAAFINVTLVNGASTSLVSVWNTTGFAKGNYTLSAYAWAVQGETHTSDNNFTGGWVVVSMVGDLTGGSENPWDFVPDGVVDGSDLSIVAKCYGSWPEALPPMVWNVNCDVNNDGVVDGSDLAIIAKHFGEGGP